MTETPRGGLRTQPQITDRFSFNTKTEIGTNSLGRCRSRRGLVIQINLHSKNLRPK